MSRAGNVFRRAGNEMDELIHIVEWIDEAQGRLALDSLSLDAQNEIEQLLQYSEYIRTPFDDLWLFVNQLAGYISGEYVLADQMFGERDRVIQKMMLGDLHNRDWERKTYEKLVGWMKEHPGISFPIHVGDIPLLELDITAQEGLWGEWRESDTVARVNDIPLTVLFHLEELLNRLLISVRSIRDIFLREAGGNIDFPSLNVGPTAAGDRLRSLGDEIDQLQQTVRTFHQICGFRSQSLPQSQFEIIQFASVLLDYLSMDPVKTWYPVEQTMLDMEELELTWDLQKFLPSELIPESRTPVMGQYWNHWGFPERLTLLQRLTDSALQQCLAREVPRRYQR